MGNSDTEIISKVLKLKGRDDIGQLLANCTSAIDETGEFGTYWNSIISSFVIFAPLEQYYALRQLSEADQDLLLESVLDLHPHSDGEPEIVGLEFRILTEDQQKADAEPENHGQEANVIQVFLSYSTHDKKLANSIKTGLEDFGLRVFMAHEDIVPSSEWQGTILLQLERTDIYIPIITPNFRRSEWTDQEAGIALALEKVIVPIAVDGNLPYGFLGKYQAQLLQLDEAPTAYHYIHIRLMCEKIG